MRPTNTDQALDEILFRIQTLEPLIAADTEESGRVTKGLIQKIIAFNQANEAKAKTIYVWHHLNGLTIYDGKNNPKIYPPDATDALKQPPAPYQHILSWSNETGEANAPAIATNSVILVPQYEQLFTDIAPHATTKTPEGIVGEQLALCRSAFLRILDPAIGRINGKSIHASYAPAKKICVILIGPNPATACPKIFNTTLTNYVSRVVVPRPSREEIQRLVTNTVENTNLTSSRTKGPLKEDHTCISHATDTLTGLTMFQASNALAQSIIKTRDLDPNVLKDSYREIVEQHPALTLPDYKETWASLIGAERYKRHIEASFHPDNLKLTHPRGVIIVGVPGAGKSHAAKATGHRLGLPVIFANIGRVFGSLVGESERLLEQMFKIIDAIGNCVLFIDEIEKALGGMANSSGGDSGTSQRVFSTLLTWLNDRPNGAFIIATCNNLHLLPPEVTRSGRWDATFFMDVPTHAQRLQLLEHASARYQMDGFFDKAAKEGLAKQTKLWTGSELLKLIETTRRLLPLQKEDNETNSPAQAALKEAFTYIKPLSQTNPSFQQDRARNAVIGVPASIQDKDQQVDKEKIDKIHSGATPIFKADLPDNSHIRDINLN